MTCNVFSGTLNRTQCVCACDSCYGMALKQQPSMSALWHDLGVCYYRLTKVVEGHLVKVVAGKCVEALKQALMLDPNNHAHWNAVGVAAAHNGRHSSFMVALCNRADHYIFILFLLSSFFSSPNLSGRRLDVYHTLVHGVALVRI